MQNFDIDRIFFLFCFSWQRQRRNRQSGKYRVQRCALKATCCKFINRYDVLSKKKSVLQIKSAPVKRLNVPPKRSQFGPARTASSALGICEYCHNHFISFHISHNCDLHYQSDIIYIFFKLRA